MSHEALAKLAHETFCKVQADNPDAQPSAPWFGLSQFQRKAWTAAVKAAVEASSETTVEVELPVYIGPKNCVSCTWWGGSGDVAPGTCHKSAPAGNGWPITWPADFCGEFHPSIPPPSLDPITDEAGRKKLMETPPKRVFWPPSQSPTEPFDGVTWPGVGPSYSINDGAAELKRRIDAGELIDLGTQIGPIIPFFPPCPSITEPAAIDPSTSQDAVKGESGTQTK